ncbi:MAG: hypothetical protein F6K17_16350, partial [Okeania sp. SIO3C4]|nr:hypothetical protein [Okeania sp. SIO3C4]
LVIGGEQYADSIALQKNILMIISLYIFLLPFDRYSGMALFALNRPGQNFYKIMIMLIANVLIDLVAVFHFQSLELVAVGTVVFTFVGIAIGWKWTMRGSDFGWHDAKDMCRNKVSLHSKLELKRSR